MKRRAQLVLLLAAMLSAGSGFGCGATLKVSPGFTTMPMFLAVLPAEAPPELSPQRVAYLNSLLVSELQARGFYVLDERWLQRLCADSKCSVAANSGDPNLQGFVQLGLGSFGRNNFLAGYYNAVRGGLSVFDREHRKLLYVHNVEDETGGLVFESGQVVEGLVSSFDNTPDQSFNRLGARFITHLVAKLPKEKSAEKAAAPSAKISAVEIAEPKAGEVKVCISAPEGSAASLLFASGPTNLRDIGGGQYCGRYSSALLKRENALVDLKSPYGGSDRRPVMLPAGSSCETPGLRLNRSGSVAVIELSCAELQNCPPAERCMGRRMLIYHAASPEGPYEQIAQFAQTSFPASLRRAPEGGIFQAVFISPIGETSLPITIGGAK